MQGSGKNSQNNQRHNTVYFGKYPRGKTGGIHIYNLHKKVFLDILQDSEKEIGKEK